MDTSDHDGGSSGKPGSPAPGLNGGNPGGSTPPDRDGSASRGRDARDGGSASKGRDAGDGGSASKARPCPRCGALNGVGFDRCIRCAAPLSSVAQGAEALKGSVDATNLWGTKAIIGLTALVFAGQLAGILKLGGKGLLTGGSRLDLMRWGAMLISVDHVADEPYRLLSAVFVHIGALHFVMNMISLANIARVVEPGVGSARFVVAYLVSGIVGFASNIVVEAVLPDAGPVPVLTAGASGAVFGAMGLILGWLLRRRDRRWRQFAIQAVFYALVLNLAGMRINNGAHIGGLLCGAAFGAYFAGNPRPKNLLWMNVGAIVGLVLSVLSLLLSQRAANWGRRPALPSVALERDAASLVDPQRASRPPAHAFGNCALSRRFSGANGIALRPVRGSIWIHPTPSSSKSRWVASSWSARQETS